MKQSSYHYEEVIYSIEKWLIDGDLDSKETKGNQAYTYEIDPSPISEQKQNGQRQIKEVLDTSNFPSEHLQDRAKRSTLIISTSTSQSIKKKRKKWKGFGKFDGHVQHSVGIDQSPQIFRIGQGTLEKKPMDLLEEVFDTSNFPSEHLQDQAERSTLITSTSTSQSIKKKEKSGKDLVNLMAMYNTLLGLIKVLKYSKLDRAHQKSSPWICLKVSRFLRWISTKTSNAMGHLFVSYF